MEFRQTKLNNQLEVIAEIHPKAFTASYGIFVNTGARDEDAPISGMSHFLEHMVFKGTPTRNAAEINRQFDRLGASANAYTSEERTVYHATVLPEFQEKTIELLCDMMLPQFDPHEFSTEKQVILEEISMYDDQPPYGGFEKAMELYFGKHPLSARVLGTHASVEGITVEQMAKYHNQRYRTGNICVCATGNVDFDQLVEQVTRFSANWIVGEAGRKKESLPKGSGDSVMHHSAANQNYWIRFSPGPCRHDNDRYAMRLLSMVLGDETGSRTFWELIDTGLAEGAALFSQEYDDEGLLQAYLCTSPEDFEEAKNIFAAVIQSALSQPVTDAELQQAVRKVCSSILLSAEKSSNRLFTVGAAWLSRHTWETAEEIVAKYRSVTIHDLQRVAEKYLQSPALSLTVCAGSE